MDSESILTSAEERIRETRAALARFNFVAASGEPLAGFRGRVRLVNHEFKLGCNAFGVGRDGAEWREYEARFARLLNFGTLPFYWNRYEADEGRPGAAAVAAMAEWCASSGVTTKGHPLVWHEQFPEWAEALPDEEVIARLEARVRGIVGEFEGLIDIWDVVNEATVSERFDNAIGRWMKSRGASACVGDALSWAREAAPGARLLYNDFNVSPEFEALAEGLACGGTPLSALGVQSHMHKGAWTAERVWNTCETYARFGLPLHFTEMTILSGRLKTDDDWHAVQPGWTTTAEGEARQLAEGSAIYTALFSHPAVEAVTWWDFSDRASWQGAPSGLLRADMSPKPLYDWLVDSFCPGGRWSTDAAVAADAHGRARAECFFGDYECTGRCPEGPSFAGRFTLTRKGPREVDVILA